MTQPSPAQHHRFRIPSRWTSKPAAVPIHRRAVSPLTTGRLKWPSPKTCFSSQPSTWSIHRPEEIVLPSQKSAKMSSWEESLFHSPVPCESIPNSRALKKARRTCGVSHSGHEKDPSPRSPFFFLSTLFLPQLSLPEPSSSRNRPPRIAARALRSSSLSPLRIPANQSSNPYSAV